MNKAKMKKYAELIVKVGANVQPGQVVWIYYNLEQLDFLTILVKECYKAKAKRVDVIYSNDALTKLNYKYMKTKDLGEVLPYEESKLQYSVDVLPVRIHILSDDPDGLKGIDQHKVAEARKMKFPITKPYRDKIENRQQWVIAAVPGKKWAKKVYPHLPVNKAVEELWNAILRMSHATDEPIEAWKKHNAYLKEKMDKLNALDIDYLEYHSSNGTDFKVWLLPKAKWIAGGEVNIANGVYYNPNIPTEECFITPWAGKAEGVVHASKPLSYAGELIEDFSIYFENGKVSKVEAKKNQKLLEVMISQDEGAKQLGEVALVPFESSVNQEKTIFYETLFDENACCHLALGQGFSNCYEGFENMTTEELKEAGINDSMIHVDFMIGTRDLSIKAHLRDGRVLDIFKEGTWAI